MPLFFERNNVMLYHDDFIVLDERLCALCHRTCRGDCGDV